MRGYEIHPHSPTDGDANADGASITLRAIH